MSNLPDPRNPQQGDRFKSDGGDRTIIAVTDDWCMVDLHNGERPVVISRDYIARYFTPLPTWPPLPTDHFAWQRPDGHVSIRFGGEYVDNVIARNPTWRKVRVTYTEVDQ